MSGISTGLALGLAASIAQIALTMLPTYQNGTFLNLNLYHIRPVLSMYFLPSFRPSFRPSFGLYLYTYPIEKTVFHVFSRLLTEQK
jgi:hypothetical protein